jgi:hypothetical protein
MHILSCHHVYLLALCGTLVIVRVTFGYLNVILFSCHLLLLICCASAFYSDSYEPLLFVLALISYL